MHNHWLLQINSDHFTFDQLLEKKKISWKYVKNHIGLKELRNIKEGDVILIFENGDEKAVTGLAEAISNPYKDENAENSKALGIDIKFIKKLTRTIPFWKIKNNPKLKDIDLWQIPELEVCPVEEDQWDEFLHLAKEK